MSTKHPLLFKIEAFLSETGMSSTYFGKLSVGNSELVERLRNGGDIRRATAKKIRDFIVDRRRLLLKRGCNANAPRVQGVTKKRRRVSA